MKRQPAYEVIFSDEHFLAVNKSSGMLSVPDRFDPGKPNLLDALSKELEQKIYGVHRLDAETSGLLLFARNAETHRALSLQFEERQVKKYYIAFVDGNPAHEADDIEAPIAENPMRPGTMRVHSKGKAAHSSYRVLERFRDFSMLEVELHTGRTHQIRVHCAHIGHPLLVDKIYGVRAGLMLSSIKRRKFKLSKSEEEESPFFKRLSLHAWKLHFQHPVSGEAMELEAPLTRDLNALHNQLCKWGKASDV